MYPRQNGRDGRTSICDEQALCSAPSLNYCGDIDACNAEIIRIADVFLGEQ